MDTSKLIGRRIMWPSVSLDDQVLRLRLDNHRVAYVPLQYTPQLGPLANATYEQAMNVGWDRNKRTVTWPLLDDFTVGWDEMLAAATVVRRERLRVSLIRRRWSGNGPGIEMYYGCWGLRLSWGQVAFWKEHQALVWWLNPREWKGVYTKGLSKPQA